MFMLKSLGFLCFFRGVFVESSQPQLNETESYHKISNVSQNGTATSDFPFFSKPFASRLEIWMEKVTNASRQCSKHDISVEKYVDTDFPVFKMTVDRQDAFLLFDTIHPVLVRGRSEQNLMKIASVSILELWPLLALCFSCAALSGMIVWLLDSRTNSEQFPKPFWRGIFDGMWWAIATMTTVGYGDKSPKSFFARLFATAWMVAGIVLLSMFTAQVSCRLTAQELRSDDHLVDKKIGVPCTIEGSDYVHEKMAFTIVKAIDEPIKAAEELSRLNLDSVLVFHCEDKIDDKLWEVLQLMPPLQIGAELCFSPRDDEPMEFGIEEKYIRCMKNRINAKCRGKKPGNVCSRSRSASSSCEKLVREHDKLKFEFKWVYFKNLTQYLIPFCTVIGVIILVFAVGTIRDYCCRKRRNKFKPSDLEASQSGLIRHKSIKEGEPMLDNDSTKC